MKVEEYAKRLNVDLTVAQQVRDIITGALDPETLEGGAARVAECYNRPAKYDIKLHAINKLIEGFGVEYVAHIDDTQHESQGLDYVNLGDSYTCTVIFDHLESKFVVADIGSIIEDYMDSYI